jgi:Flp pilus assembly protein TadB
MAEEHQTYAASLEDIKAAAERISQHAHVTPVRARHTNSSDGLIRQQQQQQQRFEEGLPVVQASICFSCAAGAHINNPRPSGWSQPEVQV